MLVVAKHPAVVTHVPPRGRHERLSLVAMRTPVEVPEAPLSDMACLDSRPRYSDTAPHLHRSSDGGYWRPMEWSHCDPVKAEDLGRYLECDPAGRGDLYRYFRGTPVAAWDWADCKDVTGMFIEGLRGHDIDLDRSRAIMRDDRARAPAALVRHVTERVRIAGGVAWTRVSQSAVLYDCGGRQDGRAWAGEENRISDFRYMVVPPAGLDLARSHKGFPCLLGDGKVTGIAALLARDPDPSADARALGAYLNGAAGLTRVALDACLSSLRDGARSVHTYAALRREVGQLELDALTGQCGACDPIASLQVIGRALKAAVALDLSWHHSLALWDLEGFYMPMAILAADRASPIPPEDVAEISAAMRLA